MATLSKNKKAHFSYEIEETVEAGIVLAGHEVKSVKNGQASLAGAYVTLRNGECFLRNAYIGRYKNATGLTGYNETADRKLLLHKSEILKMSDKTKGKGLTLIPLEFYTKKSLVKLKIALARGKKEFDKRDTIKKKEQKRNIDRLIKTKV